MRRKLRIWSKKYEIIPEPHPQPWSAAQFAHGIGEVFLESCLPCQTPNLISYFSYLYEVITLCRNRTLTPEMEEEVADMLVYYPPRTLVYRYVPCRGLSADLLFRIRNVLI
jgi:hypothetical protein